jgi:hypothetical protein
MIPSRILHFEVCTVSLTIKKMHNGAKNWASSRSTPKLKGKGKGLSFIVDSGSVDCG